MKDLFQKLKSKPDTIIYPFNPDVSSSLKLPSDLVEFYSLCNGMTLFSDQAFPVHFLGLDKFEQAYFAFLWDKETIQDRKEELKFIGKPFICDDWYALANLENGDYIIIDLNEERMGHCYACHFSTFADPGDMPIIARSFTELVHLLLEYYDDDQRYFFRQGFHPFGDAFDEKECLLMDYPNPDEVKNIDDFIRFMKKLEEDFHHDNEHWKNIEIPDYLESIKGYMEDTKDHPDFSWEGLDWSKVALLFYIGKIYE